MGEDMKTGSWLNKSVAALSMLVVSGGPALAAGLPNGATQLRENYQDWAVLCQVTGADGADKVGCRIEQVQMRANSRQRVLQTTIVMQAGGAAKGSFVLPFGLALEDGVTLQIDGGRVTKPLPFKTCINVGCVVQFEWPTETIEGLRGATTLKLGAKNVNGTAVPFSVPLRGLSAAVDRALALAPAE